MGSSKDHSSCSGDDITDAPEQLVIKISCIECRRLKRKCDRIQPCNQCKRYGKTCVFPVPEAPRRGKKYLAEIRERMEKLERLLSEHAPHVNLDDLDAMENHILNPRRHSKSPSISTSPINFMSPRAMIHRSPESSTSALVLVDDQTPVTNAPSRPPTSSAASVEHALISPISRSYYPTTKTSDPRIGIPSPYAATPSATDAYERQPRNASGYEWNERTTYARENDGTASLSVEPDGEGYLGFASGASLLRILQISAGGVSLSNLSVHADSPAPEGWEPSAILASSYVDAYFQHYHPQYPIIHEATFRAQYAEVVAQPPRSQWLVLVNTIIAIGAFCCSQPMYVVDYFLEKAVSVINAEHLETGSLVLVQAFTLLSNISQKRNKSNSGSTYLGIAVRMAIGLGLHRELPLWSIKPFEREVRRRVWWVLIIFDAGASITFGRPILLPYGEADCASVHNVTDREFTPSSPTIPPPALEPTIYTSLIYQASFHCVGKGCYGRVISTPPPSSEQVFELDQDLRRWYETVPPWMTPQVSASQVKATPWIFFSAHKLFWRYNNLRIILHRRAFLERALKRQSLSRPATPDADLEHTLASICLQCSMETIFDIHLFFQNGSLTALERWYALHFIFQASFVPLIALHTDALSHERGAWSESVMLARETLKRVQEDPLADRCLRIIDRLTPLVPEAAAVIPLPDQLQTNPMWQGPAADIAQDLLPFADLETLMSFWPGTPSTTISS